MSIRDVIDAEETRLHAKAGVGRLPPSQLTAVVSKVCARFAEGGTLPKPADLALLIKRFRQAVDGNALDQFSLSEWTQVCWGMWDTPEPLAEQSAFLDVLLAKLWDGPSRALCRTLIAVYLTRYAVAPVSMHRIAQSLARLVSHWSWPWDERHQRFGLFSHGKAPPALARHCLEPGAPLEIRLEDAGIKGLCRFGGMEAAAFRVGLDSMQEELATLPAHTSRPYMERVLAWYEAARVAGASSFEAQRPVMARALLMPWQAITPEDGLRERLIDFLLKHLKDPRIHPERWSQVPEQATAIFRRWLTRIALEQFFEVVDQVAEQGHWMYRRPFWMSYEKGNYIEDAWVLFGPRARRLARAVLKDTSGYGSIDNPRQNDHSILLLRIGGLTIAEVSHMGRCRIWKDGNRNAPVLYKTSAAYRRSELETDADFDQVHHGSEQMTWQRHVAGFIMEVTGILPNAASWRPQ